MSRAVANGQSRRHPIRRAILLGTGAFLLVGVTLIGLVIYRHNHPEKPLPSRIDALTEALQEAAEKKLAASSMADEQLTIAETPELAAARAGEVIDAAIQAGGVAVKTVAPDGTISLLAQVPGRNAELFRGLVRKEQITRQAPERDGEMRLIEVIIQLRPASETAAPAATAPTAPSQAAPAASAMPPESGP